MKYLFLTVLMFISFKSFAFNPDIIRNNKESVSRKISQEEIKKMNIWMRSHELSENQIYQRSVDFFSFTLTEFIKHKNYCDLYIPSHLITFASNEEIIRSDNEIFHFLVYLRNANLIDDLFYDLLKKSTKIMIGFEQNKNKRAVKPANTHRRYSLVNDLEKFYDNFKTWPNEVNSCTIQTYLTHINKLGLTNAASRSKDLMKLNWLAFNKGILSLETYNRLEVLRNANITNWPITTTRYIDIVKNAKDKLADRVEEEPTDDFSSIYVLRKENLTRRGKLYAAYNSTQVFLMAQIIERTAKRMDAKYVELSFHYDDGEGEIYVLSPMEQYRIAINMLKKEIAELIRSESFKGLPFDYGDLIASAYETGLLRSDDIDQVLKFEDFWNPKIPRWKTYLNYAVSIAGTATYYLPPPWNLLGAVGLILTQMKIEQGPDADPSDNWTSIIN